MLAAEISDRNPGFVLFQNPNDLIFRKPFALHALVLVLGQSEFQTGLTCEFGRSQHRNRAYRGGHVWTCGRRPGKNFLTFCSIGRVRLRIRPVCAAGMAAGPNALRGSGPKQSGALLGALTQAGSPDPRNNRICITSSCPRQFVEAFYPLSAN
jgi:hypothetical protein